MKDQVCRATLDDWARQRNLLRPNETLFAKKQMKAQQLTVLLRTYMSDKRIRGSGCPIMFDSRHQSVTATAVKS